MSKYYENSDILRKEYFKVLSPVFPEWLLDLCRYTRNTEAFRNKYGLWNKLFKDI